MTINRFLLLILLTPAYGFAESPFSLGAEIGYTDIRQNDFDDNWGYRAYGSYRFHQNFSIEAGYGDLGDFDIDEPGIKASVDVNNVYDILLVLHSTISTEYNTRLELKIGGYHADVETDLVGRNDESGDTGYTTGISLIHPINQQLEGVVSWRYYDEIDDVDFTSLMLGARYRF
ncbi:porin family protein [bacterium]|nr:porin family protein [bacterium]